MPVYSSRAAENKQINERKKTRDRTKAKKKRKGERTQKRIPYEPQLQNSPRGGSGNPAGRARLRRAHCSVAEVGEIFPPGLERRHPRRSRAATVARTCGSVAGINDHATRPTPPPRFTLTRLLAYPIRLLRRWLARSLAWVAGSQAGEPPTHAMSTPSLQRVLRCEPFRALSNPALRDYATTQSLP